ncbi:MAG: hypothetical protein K8R90_06945 [Candidatus Cloacimonetes bacterium]|nr:hypothetical protein [Candidatus Cloacimonadota bacterium]
MERTRKLQLVVSAIALVIALSACAIGQTVPENPFTGVWQFEKRGNYINRITFDEHLRYTSSTITLHPDTGDSLHTGHIIGSYSFTPQTLSFVPDDEGDIETVDYRFIAGDTLLFVTAIDTDWKLIRQ